MWNVYVRKIITWNLKFTSIFYLLIILIISKLPLLQRMVITNCHLDRILSSSSHAHTRCCMVYLQSLLKGKKTIKYILKTMSHINLQHIYMCTWESVDNLPKSWGLLWNQFYAFTGTCKGLRNISSFLHFYGPKQSQHQ